MNKQRNIYKIELTQVERNGMHLLAARYDTTFDTVVTMALDAFLRQKLNKRDYETLEEDDLTNQRIGEWINANRGGFGYDPEVNPAPRDKRHYFIPIAYDDVMV